MKINKIKKNIANFLKNEDGNISKKAIITGTVLTGILTTPKLSSASHGSDHSNMTQDSVNNKIETLMDNYDLSFCEDPNGVVDSSHASQHHSWLHCNGDSHANTTDISIRPQCYKHTDSFTPESENNKIKISHSHEFSTSSETDTFSGAADTHGNTKC